MASAAFVLNLDAEDELRFGDAHTTSGATRARIAALVPRLAALVEGAVLVDPWDPTPGCAAGLRGRAWCPTPRALVALQIAGASLPDAPPRAVLRRANDRAFSAALGQTLPGARFVTSLAEARAIVAEPGETGQWLVKPALGFAGRGHLRIPAGELSGAVAQTLASLLRMDGGAQLEPLVPREGDFALHGFVRRDGSFALGAPTSTRVDERGTWRSSELAADGELDRGEHDALVTAAEEVARALFAVGYAGPFNTDAFRWRDRNKTPQFNARCEVNARFSMGWAVGMRMLTSSSSLFE